MSNEKNELLTRTGRETPTGQLFRRYWQPVALTEELPTEGRQEPLAVKVMGEDLVVYRGPDGAPNLIGRFCPHRGTDLAYGRVEDGGLRCLYHGWLFDGSGSCLETPAAPPGSLLHTRVEHVAYPCREASGIIFAYMGPGEPPELPMYEAMRAPAEHRWSTKLLQRCNYLQGIEGHVDPAHTSFLHRFLGERDVNRTIRGHHPWDLLQADVNPTISTEVTNFGLRVFAVRSITDDQDYFRVTNFVMPNMGVVAGATGEDGYTINWNVPIDDTSHWLFKIEYRRSQPLDVERRAERFAREFQDYVPVRSDANHWRQDRAQMDDVWYAGMDELFPVHDTFAIESQGLIVDRSLEHLAPTDKAIVNMRRLLLEALEALAEGKDPRNVVRDAAEAGFDNLLVMSDVVPAGGDPNDVVEAASREFARIVDGSDRAGG